MGRGLRWGRGVRTPPPLAPAPLGGHGVVGRKAALTPEAQGSRLHESVEGNNHHVPTVKEVGGGTRLHLSLAPLLLVEAAIGLAIERGHEHSSQATIRQRPVVATIASSSTVVLAVRRTNGVDGMCSAHVTATHAIPVINRFFSNPPGRIFSR